MNSKLDLLLGGRRRIESADVEHRGYKTAGTDLHRPLLIECEEDIGIITSLPALDRFADMGSIHLIINMFIILFCFI